MHYIGRMTNVFAFLTVLAMMAVVGALFIGLFAMAKGGDFDRKYGNKMMRLRVLLQGLALVLFALAVLTAT